MKRSVLVVDNHPAMLKFASRLLDKKGFEVWTAENGLSALDILKHRTPDVVFIDLVMPNIPGEKLCRMIRSMPKTRRVPIIILSAIAAEEEVDFRALGADGCIAKGPFDKMASNILAALKRLESPQIPDTTHGILGCEDVDRREITRELLFSRRHLEVILDHMREGLLELTDDARVVSANAAAISILGTPEEQMLGDFFINRFSGGERRKIGQMMEMMAGGDGENNNERLITISGRQVFVRMFRIQDGRERSMAVILNDVTEKKEIEAQLFQAEKMKAIGTLAGGIAHDFNNLLMAIQGNAALLRIQKKPEEPDAEKLGKIEEYVAKGADLTRQLLGFARKGRYELKAVNLNQVIESSLNVFGRARKELFINVHYEERPWLVLADPGQMEQVFMNLFINASQAMPDGGELSIETRNVRLGKEQAKRLELGPGRYVSACVTDSGTGVAVETQDHIFEPFFTTKEVGEGAGLGLASVYGIIKDHKGAIDVKSRVDEGSTFRIFLPVSEFRVRATADALPEKRSLGNTETILLVDDEDMILETAGQMLVELGYRPLFARNGKEALNILEQRGHVVDLVILDMIMPGMDGRQTFAQLKEKHPETKILFTSGYDLEEKVAELLQRNSGGFIQKPYDIGKFSRKIRELLDA